MYKLIITYTDGGLIEKIFDSYQEAKGFAKMEGDHVLEYDIKKEDLVTRLRKRAEIRRQIPSRKSVQNGERDRLADLLDEAADEIQSLNGALDEYEWASRGD